MPEGTDSASAPDTSANQSADDKKGEVSPRGIHLLETLDDVVHLIVASLLIVFAVAVLGYACYAFGRETISLFSASPISRPPEHTGPDPFSLYSVDFLSNLLFAVILLEVLRTILTYLKSRRIRDITEDFLVVGILTIVRKILLVGAYSSISGETGLAFVREASGTLVSIAGVLLLIAALAWLHRIYPDNRGEL